MKEMNPVVLSMPYNGIRYREGDNVMYAGSHYRVLGENSHNYTVTLVLAEDYDNFVNFKKNKIKTNRELSKQLMRLI